MCIHGDSADGRQNARTASVLLVAVDSNSFETIVVSEDGVAARVTLNRPETRNALSLRLVEDLIDSLEQLSVSPYVRVIVIEGAGVAFSAGHDLSEMVDRDPSFYQRLYDACTQLMEAIRHAPQPVIAKVHGMATAAGCQLVAACDLVVAAEDAQFATPGVMIGLFCSTPMVPLSRAIGRKRALEMLLTGQSIDAATALDWGLVNRVVPAERLSKEVADLVETIKRAGPPTVRFGKETFYEQLELSEQEAYDLTKKMLTKQSMSANAQEGIRAFLQKRRPSWRVN
jgi:enoyl-CoA hydratase/carnithine racemase